VNKNITFKVTKEYLWQQGTTKTNIYGQIIESGSGAGEVLAKS